MKNLNYKRKTSPKVRIPMDRSGFAYCFKGILSTPSEKSITLNFFDRFYYIFHPLLGSTILEFNMQYLFICQ